MICFMATSKLAVFFTCVRLVREWWPPVNVAEDYRQHAQSPQIKVLDPSKYSIFLDRAQ